MRAQYAVWMRIDALCEYFMNGEAKGIAFTPSAATKRKLQAAGLGYRQWQQSLVIFSETQPNEPGLPKQPIVPPDPGLRLTFFVEVEDPAFLTFSNVDLDGLRAARFYLSNLASNTQTTAGEALLHLSAPLADYSASASYQAGELVAKSGRAFECLQPATGEDPETAASAFWVDKGEHQFVSNQDLLEVRPRCSRFEVATPSNAFDIRVFGLDTGSGNYDLPLLSDTLSLPHDESKSDVLVDLAALEPARYRVQINGQSFHAYFDDEAKQRGALGVIDLFHHLPDTDDYSPLDATGALREVRYKLAFANRRGLWRYHTPLHKVNEIVPVGGGGGASTFVAGPSNDYFQSNRPLALSESPTQNAFELVVEGNNRPAPHPDPRAPGVLSHTYDHSTKTWRGPVFNIWLNL